MSTTPVLSTEPRNQSGSSHSRRERRAGRVPVNIYGHGQPNASVTVDAHDLGLALATPAQVFTLTLSDGEQSCLVREVQYDTWGQEVLHVDMARVDLNEAVAVTVPLDFVGTAAGLSEGGQQEVRLFDLAVRCPARAIPEVITVNVSALNVGDTMTAGDLALPEGVTLDLDTLNEGDPIVGVVVSKRAQKADAEDGEAEDGEGGADAEGGDKPAEGDGGGDS